jgi:hypothetical protein
VRKALAIDSDEDMSSDQKKTVAKSVKKKMGGVMDHIRVVKSCRRCVFSGRTARG